MIDAAKTKPFGFQAFYPGPGLGGHCIPIDPFYLTWVARNTACQLASSNWPAKINTVHARFVVSARSPTPSTNAANRSRAARSCCSGMAYKKDVDDPRESPAIRTDETSSRKGGSVAYNDPYIPRLPSMRHYPQLNMSSQELTVGCLELQECVLIVTDHSSYDWNWIARFATLIVDTRNATKGVVDPRAEIVRA